MIADDPRCFGYSGVVKTPLSKRWPAILLFGLSILVAGVSSSTFWVQAVVLIGMFLLSAVVLRFLLGWPWSRIMRYREPDSPPSRAPSRTTRP